MLKLFMKEEKYFCFIGWKAEISQNIEMFCQWSVGWTWKKKTAYLHPISQYQICSFVIILA